MHLIYLRKNSFYETLQDLSIVEISDDENLTPAAPAVPQLDPVITKESIMAALKESFGIVIEKIYETNDLVACLSVLYNIVHQKKRFPCTDALPMDS